MDDLRSALIAHVGLVEKLSGELRAGFRPAVDNLVTFFRAIDWKEQWLIWLLMFHFVLLITAIASRRNDKFQFFLSVLAFTGIYFAERLNNFLGENWRSFASQNYFDSNGLFISVLWSGPLLLISMLIVLNTLFTLCRLIVKWKRAELRHQARLARDKQD